ncbi:MAG: HAMP domain-containing histidine kinase [Clostridiales bacterium]|nr:HAMP domain-containing histidine kinase [Clostridiales bacterium]
MNDDNKQVAPDEEKKEAVKQTIAEIKSENSERVERKSKSRSIAFKIFCCIFFPVTLCVIGFRKLSKKLKIGITAKTTVVFTVVFGLMLIGYAAFMLASIGKLSGSGESISSAYMQRLIITSAVVVLVFIILGAVLGGFSSQYMISPVRKITHRVKEISEENNLSASARLDPVDSQDELMELTEQINSMLDSLQQAFERQENFVSDASHELKTPLAVIAGYANLLRRWGKDDPKVLAEAVEAISRESENMKRIVEQLLWLAKLGDFALNCTEFNLYETVAEVVDGYKLLNTGHQIELVGELSVTLNTDKNLLTEAVRTLVDNAIKYTPAEKGVIKLFIECVEGGVEIAVQDNGMGISQEDQAQIFDRFFRCDKVRGRESGSSGLGLTICKQIVEMMGGTISVESEKGKGSTFVIALTCVVQESI